MGMARVEKSASHVTLRKSIAFRIVGFGLAGLAVLTGVAHIVRQALSGGWNEPYRSAKLVPWTYGGAFIVICVAAVAGLVGLFFYLRERRPLDP